jgi:predicted GIY-YIG superfamily endonuclease
MAALTQDEAVARCLEHGYQWPEGVVYEGAKKSYPLVCSICGNDCPKRFHNLGKRGCKKCARVARALTHEEVEARGLAAKYPAQLLEPYKGDLRFKHLYRFLRCGDEWEITPNNLGKGKGCGQCYHDQFRTYVYVMEHEEFDAYKIGVTSASPTWPHRSRIYQHESNGWTLVIKLEMATRKEAMALEKATVDGWRAKGFRAGVTKEQMLSGYGETVSRGRVDLCDILGMMER